MLRTIAYALMWFLVSWLSLRDGYGDLTDHLLVAGGLFLVHAALASVIGNTRRYARAALLPPYVLASTCLLLLLLLYGALVKSGGEIDGDAMRAVLQTDLAEATAYLDRLISPIDVVSGLSIAVLLVATFPQYEYAVSIWTTTALALGIVIGAAAVHLGSIPLISPIELYAARYFQEVRTFRAVLDRRRSEPVTGARSDFAGTAVVVIGESTSRHHMSRYGYSRPTTPGLDARGETLIAFSDVISPHSHTVPALAAALTSSGETDEQRYFAENSVDILSLAQSAGLETYWLSNQNEFGLWDNPITALAKEADRTRFFSSATGQEFKRSSYDQDMLPSLRKILESSAAAGNLVFLHSFANHWPYCDNHPAAFGAFHEPLGQEFFGNAAESKDINCYDDGIRYVDAVLDEAIQIVAESHHPAVLMYFSDHGEAALLGTGHDSFRHSSYHIEVPLFVWANAAYEDSHGERLAAARSNVGRPYTTARLFHSIAQIAGIEHASVDLRQSLFSDSLTDAPRTSINGKVKYDEWAPTNDYRENASINVGNLGARQQQVWAHRINSLGALAEASSTLRGVEMDLVFVDPHECFRVYHPPAPDTSLSLADMLAAAQNKPELSLWLDWKNATPQNIRAAIECLNALDARFKIRHRALVETGTDAVFREISLLSQAGYAHGYYLPTEAILRCMRTCDEAGATNLAATIMNAVERGGYSSITFDWRLNDFVKRRLHDWVLGRKLRMYSWDMSIDIAADQAAPSKIAEHFSALDLAGLLVTFPSIFRI